MCVAVGDSGQDEEPLQTLLPDSPRYGFGSRQSRPEKICVVLRNRIQCFDNKGRQRAIDRDSCLCGVQEKFVALQRYTKQLDGEEDRLAALQKEMADLKAKRNQLQSELDAVVMKLTIDETL